MLFMDRDFKRGGERFAIPTQGEVEGKLVVLEVVAVTCLRGAVASNDEFETARLKKEVFRVLRERCAVFHLSPEDEAAAMDYADEFFEAAKTEAQKSGTAPSGTSGNG
ncbi:hypothetical protein [Rhizobium sp. 18055]|jgi:hypothetical protein|uniref:hypothetical protein n=1 Tax=Rhizobium sp. 18055 TaxID=2681403 RepID=UPI00135B1410|nr:hypothetical protein [Rhizobium sp. 18055]